MVSPSFVHAVRARITTMLKTVINLFCDSILITLICCVLLTCKYTQLNCKNSFSPSSLRFFNKTVVMPIGHRLYQEILLSSSFDIILALNILRCKIMKRINMKKVISRFSADVVATTSVFCDK